MSIEVFFRDIRKYLITHSKILIQINKILLNLCGRTVLLKNCFLNYYSEGGREMEWNHDLMVPGLMLND